MITKIKNLKVSIFLLVVLCLFARMSHCSAQSSNFNPISDCLFPGESLYVGDYIYSNDGSHYLVLQVNGDLELYDNSDPTKPVLIWSSGTSGVSVAFLAMQGDGNLVLYASSSHAVWSSVTNSRYNSQKAIWTDNDGAYLKIQNDGNFMAIYPRTVDPTQDSSNALWSPTLTSK